MAQPTNPPVPRMRGRPALDPVACVRFGRPVPVSTARKHFFALLEAASELGKPVIIAYRHVVKGEKKTTLYAIQPPKAGQLIH